MPKTGKIQSGSGYIPRILFAAGGTGGHIYPALAVQKTLAGINGRVECRFVCGSRPLEIDLYKRSGIKPVVLDIPSRQPGLIARFMDIFRMFHGFVQAFEILMKWKPDWILAQGGYVTAPVLMAARILRIPYDIQEQNTIPGRTNKWFASGARTIFCSFEEAVSRFSRIDPGYRCVYTGMPLRLDIISKQMDKAHILQEIGLDPGLPLLLVLGGSQGAANLYRHLLSALRVIDENASSCPSFQCLWSTGAHNIGWMRENLSSNALNRIKVHIRSYIDDMGMVYSVSDAAVSRSGACSVAELAANRIPAIFVPLPHSKDNHQRYNAMALVKSGAAYLVEEGAGFEEALVQKIVKLMSSSDRRKKMAETAGVLLSRNAAEAIASELIKKIKNSC